MGALSQRGWNFDSKELFLDFIDNYNSKMGQEDEEKVIKYTDNGFKAVYNNKKGDDNLLFFPVIKSFTMCLF